MQKGLVAFICIFLGCSFSCESAVLRKNEVEGSFLQVETDESEIEMEELRKAAAKMQAFCQALANGTSDKPGRGQSGIASDQIADPTCTRGVVSPDLTVCCAKECGSCGDHKLCDNPGKFNEATGKLVDQCCMTRVKKAAPSCDKDHPPCVLSPDYKETLKKWKQDLPDRHAMQDCNKAIPHARTTHGDAIDKGEFLAELYLNGETKYKEAKKIAADVRDKCDEMIKGSEEKASEASARMAKGSKGDKVVNPLTGESPYAKWQSDEESASSEAAFYKSIQDNALIIVNAAVKGLKNVVDLRAEAQKVRDVSPLQQKLDLLIGDAEHWYQEALKLWKQWQDSSKDYNCGPPPPVKNAESMCKDGNTKYHPTCNIKCAPGYDGNGTSNHLRCSKIGKFGEELAGEWTGMAACAGKVCGIPPKIKHAKTVETAIRYPEAATYNCHEGFFTPSGNHTFNMDCDTKGFFTQNSSHICKEIVCGEAPELAGAYPVPGEFKYGEEANYSCREGHTLDGLPGGRTYFHTSCQSTGQFTHGNLGCVPIRCGPVPKYSHTKVTHLTTEDQQDQHFGDEAEYECDAGYTLNHDPKGPTSFKLSCQADGEFSVPGTEGNSQRHQPRCKPICIGEPPDVQYGMQVKRDMCFGDASEVTAWDGYSLDGHPTGGLVFYITVTEQGTFDGLQVFQPVKCGVPPTAKKATTLFETEAVYHDVIEYKCEDGYSTDKTKSKGAKKFSVVCQQDGQFTALPPLGGCGNIDDCIGHTCGAHGTCVDHLMNYTCNCDSGYAMTWHKEGKQLVCGDINDCGPEACGVGKCIDGVNSYSCDCPEGYHSVDEADTGGIMQHTCMANSCGVAKEVEHASITPLSDAGEKMFYTQTAMYECKHGYTTDGKIDGPGSFSTTCQANKQFSTLETCSPITCGEVPTVKNAGASGSSAKFNETISFECSTGYTLDGTPGGENSFDVTCRSTGGFSDPQECQKISCGEAPDTSHAHHEMVSVLYQDTVEYTCFSGFTTDGTKDGPTTFTTECKENGNFTKLKQCIPKVCGHFTSGDFQWAYFKDEGEIHYPMATEVTCLDGFTVDGSPTGNKSYTVSCLASGEFSEYNPKQCKPVVCGMPPAAPNATVTTITAGKVASGGTADTPGTVIATSGGDGGNPCARCYNDEHNGICTPVEYDGDTVCMSPGSGSWGGNYCQEGGPEGSFPVKSCEPDVAATVMVFEDHVEYKCAVGFTTGGEQEAPDTYEVACLASGGFSSPTPDMLCRNVNDCEGHTCGPKGTCVDLIGPAPAYTCECEFGYVVKDDGNGEKHCGNKDDCKGVDCGVGVCKDLIGSYTCTCPGGYYVGVPEGGKKTCLPVVCAETIPVVVNGHLKSSRSGAVVFPHTLTYECDKGYSVDGTPPEARRKFQAQCKADGQLHGLATCQKISCGTPQVIEHTSLLSPELDGSVDYQEKAKYECDNGYTLQGEVGGETSFSMTCQDDGHLTPAKVCEPVKCGHAPEQPNAKAGIANEMFFGQEVKYECNLGYTLDGTANGLNEYKLHCLANGSFDLYAHAQCTPLTASIPELSNAQLFKYAGVEVMKDDVPTVAAYPDTFTYMCNPGYTTNGKGSGPTKISTRVDWQGVLEPPLPSGCQAITYSVRGLTKDAPSASYLDGVKVHIKDTDITATSQNGHFSIPSLPAGRHHFEYHADGYISGEIDIDIEEDVNTGGAADISMSPVLPRDAWRVVLKWGEQPRDLDTYGRWSSYKTNWQQKRQEGNGMSATLEHDDTNSYGPETLHISGVGHCTGGSYFCDLKYLINDYTRTGIMGDTDVDITLYNGDSIKGTWKISECESSVTEDQLWWHVFTLDGMTNQLKWNCKQGPSEMDPEWISFMSHHGGSKSNPSHFQKLTKKLKAASKKSHEKLRR